MVLCVGSFLIISVEQNDFLGDRRVVSQLSPKAYSQVTCTPGDWPDDVEQKLTTGGERTQFKLKNISHINAALLPHDYSADGSTTKCLDVVDGISRDCDCLFQ